MIENESKLSSQKCFHLPKSKKSSNPISSCAFVSSLSVIQCTTHTHCCTVYIVKLYMEKEGERGIKRDKEGEGGRRRDKEGEGGIKRDKEG